MADKFGLKNSCAKYCASQYLRFVDEWMEKVAPSLYRRDLEMDHGLVLESHG